MLVSGLFCEGFCVSTVVHCANPFLPATTVWMYDQIRTLKRYRPVVLTQLKQNLDQFPVERVFSAEDLPSVKRFFYRLVRKARGTYAGYGKWIKEVDGKLIHAHFGQEGFRCLAAKRDAQVPMVTTFYGMDVSQLPRQKMWQKRFKRLFAEGDIFLAEGAYMAQQLVRIGCLPERIRVQHLGADLDDIPFATLSERDFERPVVLTYAVFREKKGLIYAIRAFSKIAQTYPLAQMRMIGDGPLRSDLEAEIRALGLQDRVEMLGFLSHKAALEELRRATALLYPSVTATDGDTEGGAPVALIEAQASGTPIVSSLHADIPEVAPNERCGLLFPERDVAGLATGLDALLGDQTLWEQMANSGRVHVEAEHNLKIQSEKLEKIYDDLLIKK
jgi:colanic acid/amylovoran biosynthesis glycosyltransferase